MSDFIDQDLSGSTLRQVLLKDAALHEVDLTGASLERVRLNRSRFSEVDLSDSDIRTTGLHRVRMRGVELCDVQISGEVIRVSVNGVDIAPLVEAELNRRDPDRALIRPTDADGVRRGYAMVTRRWEATLERARALPPELLHESVDGEWSFIETLRHLAFATESWVGRVLRADPSPWHPLSLPWDGMDDTPGVPRDRDARPSLEDVLALRADRRAMVEDYLAELTDETLAGSVVVTDGPGWPPAGEELPVLECLSVVLNEEWEHRLYAERDLAALESSGGS